jgi:hypothetical protein
LTLTKLSKELTLVFVDLIIQRVMRQLVCSRSLAIPRKARHKHASVSLFIHKIHRLAWEKDTLTNYVNVVIHSATVIL